MGGKKAGGGFLGIGGKSGFLNTGIFSTGPEKIKKYSMTPEMIQYERDMINRQNAIATGQAPSIAQMQMNQNVDQINRAGLAMAASQRGASNPMLAFRQAQLGANQAQLEGAQAGAVMAEQERRNADQMIANQAAAQRGVAFNQDQLNLNAKLQSQKAQTDAIAGMGQSAAAGAAASDERVKKDIAPAKDVAKGVEELLKHLKPSKYEYKDSKHGTGEKVGIMAQDLEKSKAGKTLVDEDEDGTKVVDTNKAIGVLLASVAEMNKKLKKLEK